MAISKRRAIFGIGAGVYDAITSNALWREQSARLLEHRGSDRRVQRVLDVGCGPGTSAFALAERLGPSVQVVGADLSERMVRQALRHHRRSYGHLDRMAFQVADATRLPFETGAFDLVTGHSFLYLVPDQPGALREIHRVLAPGGSLVLMEPRASGSLCRASLASISQAAQAARRPLAALRFATSMLLWRLYSRPVGQMSHERIMALFGAAGFTAVGTSPTLGGLGLHCFGRKPREASAAE